MLKKFKEIMEVDEGYIVRGDEADILLVESFMYVHMK